MNYLLISLLNKETDNMYHYVQRVGNYDNLLTLKNVKHIYAINIYPKKLAYELAESLNNEMERQGRFMRHEEMFIHEFRED